MSNKIMSAMVSNINVSITMSSCCLPWCNNDEKIMSKKLFQRFGRRNL